MKQRQYSQNRSLKNEEKAFWKRMLDQKVLVLCLKNSGTALVVRETEHEMRAETQC